MIVVPLVAVAVLGGLWLIWILFARRDARRLLAIGELVMDGDLERAKAVADRWSQGFDSPNPLGRLRLATGWSLAGDHHRALSVLDSIELPQGRSGRVIRRLASEQRFDVLEALGENERARKILDDAIEEDPGAPWLLRATSKDQGEWADGSIVAQGMHVKEAFKGHRFAEAADTHEAVLRRIGRNPVARLALPLGHLILGTAQLAAGRDSAAEASFQQFVNRSTDRVAAERRVMNSRAQALLISRRLSEATSAYEAVVAGQSTPDGFAGLAMCRLRLGEVEQAARDLDRAEELGYDADKARFLRAQILVDQGRSEEAMTLAHEAARSRPSSDPQAVYTLAYVLATAHHPDAEATLRTYVMIDPNDPDLGPLLDRPAPNGRTWREYLESPPRPGPEGASP